MHRFARAGALALSLLRLAAPCGSGPAGWQSPPGVVAFARFGYFWRRLEAPALGLHHPPLWVCAWRAGVLARCRIARPFSCSRAADFGLSWLARAHNVWGLGVPGALLRAAGAAAAAASVPAPSAAVAPLRASACAVASRLRPHLKLCRGVAVAGHTFARVCGLATWRVRAFGAQRMVRCCDPALVCGIACRG